MRQVKGAPGSLVNQRLHSIRSRWQFNLFPLCLRIAVWRGSLSFASLLLALPADLLRDSSLVRPSQTERVSGLQRCRRTASFAGVHPGQ
jgi:hypothetical protein